MIDYTNQHFMFPVENEEARGYATVDAILYRDEDGLDFTGSFAVYLLHPQMGTAQFTLHPVDYPPGYRAKGCPVWVQNEIILEIANEIKKRFNKATMGETIKETEDEKNSDDE